MGFKFNSDLEKLVKTQRIRPTLSLMETDPLWEDRPVSYEDVIESSRPAPFPDDQVVTKEDLNNIFFDRCYETASLENFDPNSDASIAKIQSLLSIYFRQDNVSPNSDVITHIKQVMNELERDHDGCVVIDHTFDEKTGVRISKDLLRIKCDRKCICLKRLKYYTLSTFKEHYDGDVTKIPKAMWSKLFSSFKDCRDDADKAVLLEIYFADKIEAYRILTESVDVHFTPDEIESIVKAPNFWKERSTMSGTGSVSSNIAALLKNHADSLTFETIAHIMNQPAKYSDKMFKTFKRREKFYREKFKDKEAELVLLFESIT